jgi:hypothetical protein
MTWSSQVASHSPGIRVSALPPSTRPSRQTTTAISQCPATTTRMLATRSRSANRSRSAGAAAATRSAVVPAPISMAGPPGSSVLSDPSLAGRGTAWHRGSGLPLASEVPRLIWASSRTQVGTVRVYGRFVEG